MRSGSSTSSAACAADSKPARAELGAERSRRCRTRRSSSRPKSRAPTSSCVASSSSSTSPGATSRTSSRRSTSRRPASTPAAARSSTPRARRRSCRATLGTIGPLEAAVARSIHRLSVLVGREPGALRAELTPTAEPAAAAGHRAGGRSGGPAAPPAGYPRRRARAGRRHGAASASPWPTCSRASRSPAARAMWPARPVALGDSGTDAYVLAPGISWGIFDYGHVQARIGAAKCAQGRRAAAV